MKDPTPPASPSEQATGHYGAGYGEQVPPDAQPQLRPATDDTTAIASTEANEGRAPADPNAPVTTQGDDGRAVVFTPEDVHARPPDQTPTEDAPESEKAGLIFERS